MSGAPSRDTVPCSWLFVPGDRPERIAKAFASDAGVVIVDLEDAVKPAMRGIARSGLNEVVASHDLSRLAVRVNCLSTLDGLADLQAVFALAKAPSFLVLPKSEAAAVLRQADALLTEACLHSSLVALVESAVGLRDVDLIATATPRLCAIMFGAADMAADLGCEPAGELLQTARCKIAIACAAERIAAIDSPTFTLDDPTVVNFDATRARNLGYAAKAAIHPRQIGPINACFRPDEQALERARRIVDLAAQGVGVLDGQMIDEAMARSARALLARTM